MALAVHLVLRTAIHPPVNTPDNVSCTSLQLGQLKYKIVDQISNASYVMIILLLCYVMLYY